MFDKKCEKCGAPATVQLNMQRYLCSQHAYEVVMDHHGGELKLKPVK